MKRFCLCLGILLTGCSEDSTSPPALAPIYENEVTKLVYEVQYMKGSAPSVGKTAGGAQIWGILETNISTLLQGKIKVTVPYTLSDMKEIPAQKKDYSNEDVVSIAKENRKRSALKGDTASIYVVFVDGFFTEDGVRNGQVSGVTSVADGVIAVSIKATVSPYGVDTKLGQQLVLIHESGHALGLVNNGIAETKKHEDPAHGIHCTNLKCIMNYKLNSGLEPILEYYSNVAAEVPNFFGSECLADAAAAFHK